MVRLESLFLPLFLLSVLEDFPFSFFFICWHMGAFCHLLEILLQSHFGSISSFFSIGVTPLPTPLFSPLKYFVLRNPPSPRPHFCFYRPSFLGLCVQLKREWGDGNSCFSLPYLFLGIRNGEMHLTNPLFFKWERSHVGPQVLIMSLVSLTIIQVVISLSLWFTDCRCFC